MIATTLALCSLISLQEQLSSEQVYKAVLPSVVSLSVVKNDGSKASGTAFMALKDGCGVTAWHMVENAKSVKAKFSDGEEFEVSGLIDKDEKRDVALIKVKVADKPLLKMLQGDPEVGSKVYAIGSPLGLDFSITDGVLSQIRTIDGLKQYQVSCPVSKGSSGGPVVNNKGEVLGVVSWGLVEGNEISFAIPSSYVRGLDSSLPTQPWANVQPTTKKEDSSGDKELAEFVGGAFKQLHSYALRLHYDCELLTAYEGRLPSGAFQEELIKIKVKFNAVKDVFIDGPRGVICKQLSIVLGFAALAGDEFNSSADVRDFSSAYTTAMNRFVASFRLAELEDEFRVALGKSECTQIKAAIPTNTLTKLLAPKEQKGWKPGDFGRRGRMRFEGGFPLLGRLAYDIDSTGYVFGFLVDSNNPAMIYEVQGRTPPAEAGFRKGDIVKEVEGQSVSSIEEMKQKMIENPKLRKITILRNDKPVTLSFDVGPFLKK